MSEPARRSVEGARPRHRPLGWPAYVRGGGVVVPMLTALLAFVIGGLVVLITGHDPIATYKAIFEGTGLQWLFPWVTGEDRTTAALNLQQTLILTTPLILTGWRWRSRSAPACSTSAARASTSSAGSRRFGSAPRSAGCRGFLHIVLAVVAACLAGAAWAGHRGLAEGDGRAPTR